MLAAALMLCAAPSLRAQTPEWIWHANNGRDPGNNERRFFRKTFAVEGNVMRAVLSVTVDNEGTGFVNGQSVVTITDWLQPATADVTNEIKPGDNVLAIRGINHGGPAGVVARLELTFADGKKSTVVTDASWLAHTDDVAGWQRLDFKPQGWEKPKVVGKLGDQPWGNILAQAGGAGAGKTAQKGGGARREATPAEALFSLPDFKVERLLSGEPEEGSWVNLCKDNKGRLIVSPQWGRATSPEEENRRGLLRLTLDKSGAVAKKDFIAKPLYDAQGMVWANGALWVVVNKYSTRFESGLYKITDAGGNDQFENIQLIKRLAGGGEHGPHAVELGPDGNLWVMAGNHTKVPDGLSPDSPHRNWAEDHVLPRQWDGNGHAAGILAPGGYICRVSPDGAKWDLFCGGFRNQFDFAFNAQGELFTYDADMEWDWGMPWYRPTRVNHCVSGGEYGWRSGTGKWPDYYADSLGAVDIGLGSPTGIAFGTGAKFPARYQRALYVLDWTYGRLIAVHLEPDGSGYKGTHENFVCPLGLVKNGEAKRPLNLTDVIVGDDGAMYFTIGGRNTAAGLYRVTYTGKESTAPAKPDTRGAAARALRKQIEAFHGKADPKALDFLWPHLDSPDRALRYAARIALEWQPAETWKARALAEAKPNAGLTALLALVRTTKDTQADVFKALGKWPLASLPVEQQLAKLRVIQVSIARQGKPAADLAKMAIEKLGPQFPNKNELFNREAAQILIALGAPDIVGKTLAHMASLPTQEDQMHYLFHLRTAKNWTLEQRGEYFTIFNGRLAAAQNTALFPPANPGTRGAPMPISRNHPAFVLKWFEEAGRPYGDGASFQNFLKNFRREAVENLSDTEKVELAALITQAPQTAGTARAAPSAFPAAQKRTAIVKEWKTADLLPSLDQAGRGRNYQRGLQAFVDAQCLACHRFGNEGGGVGPDLTAVATRFSRRDILESITEPSKVVSEQFQNTTVVMKGGDDITGRVVEETGEKVVLYVNPFTQDRTEVKKSDIKSRTPSKLSPMPEGLINTLTKDDILDMIAVLESAGRRNAAAFSKQ
jgi:putative heme-binding domain-containing protein